MAKVHNNILVRGLSGAVGEQFVIRKDKAGCTIMSYRPTYDENRIFSPTRHCVVPSPNPLDLERPAPVSILDLYPVGAHFDL